MQQGTTTRSSSLEMIQATMPDQLNNHRPSFSLHQHFNEPSTSLQQDPNRSRNLKTWMNGNLKARLRKLRSPDSETREPVFLRPQARSKLYSLPLSLGTSTETSTSPPQDPKTSTSLQAFRLQRDFNLLQQALHKTTRLQQASKRSRKLKSLNLET
jgi:hypothetical protein